MTPSPHARFTIAEMRRRWDGLRAGMSARGIDALLVSGEENFQYLAGASASLALHASLTRPSIFVLPLERDPIIVSQGAHNLAGVCHVTDVRNYDELLAFPLAVVREALRDAAPALARVGAELGQEQRMGMPVGAYLELVESFADVEFVDAAPIVIGMRMVKSPAEVACMRAAADVTGRARQRLFDLVRPGMTEREVVREMRRLMYEEGADRAAFVILQHDEPGSRNQIPLDRPLRPGSVLAVDAGAYVGSYAVDYVRMATLGEASNLQRRVHAAVLEVVERMKEALRPGVTCAELHAVAVRAIEASEFDPVEPARLATGRMGHGQGILITEPPSVCAADHTVIEPGMVISTEPGIRSGDVQFQWEDVHVVTADGSEQLTAETTDLRELAW